MNKVERLPPYSVYLRLMKIIYGKQLTSQEISTCQQIALECGIMPDTARLLLYRNVDSVEKAKVFLSPSKKGFNNPFLLNGMKQAVDRIAIAKENCENVLIFGDYDADGICATAVLYYCLKEYGITAQTVIPEREEGYGLNLDKIQALNNQKKIDLIITVDCGISDSEKIKLIKEIGIDVIVTDHHEPPSEALDFIAINPKLDNQDYPFNGLCGAGVAYKLGYALIKERADKYLDFVALATVADSMDLINENRDVVVEGLKIFNSKNIRPQFKAILADNSGRTITAQTLAYNIAPRVNAGGRMGDANLALKLFLTDKETEIFDYTAKLFEYNVARQVECDKIYREAKAQINEQGLEQDQIILVKNTGWQAGFIGIVAARLVEDYSRPVIVFAEQDGKLKGSCRSIEDINIYDAILSVKDILIAFGGHSQAAGISVSNENFEHLRKRLNDFIDNTHGKLDHEKKIYAEWDVKGEFSLKFAKEIDLLEPFGVGNKRPVFTTTVGAINSRPLKAGSVHYTYKTDAIEMLDFNGGANVLTLSLPVDKKILFETNVSTFKNNLSLKGYSRQVITEINDYSSLKPYIFAKQLEMLKDLDVNEQLKTIKREDLANYKKIGTLFAINDCDNLRLFPELNDLPINLFTVNGKNCACCLVICPIEIPEGYAKIIYLDKPLYNFFSSSEEFVIDGAKYMNVLDKLSVDRSTFEQCFIRLKTLIDKDFISTYDFCSNFSVGDDIYQSIFTTTVFMELGIFGLKNGKFIFNSNIKNPLTNSKVYSKISLLKSLL